MVNKSLRTIGTNYRKNCMVSEDAVPIHSKMQNSALRDVCYLVTDGTHDTPKTLKNGVPLIKAKEIVGGIIDFENCEYISYEDHLKVIARSNPEKGDILFAHIGASLGETAFIKTNKEFSIKNVALFKPNPSKIDNRYLFYYVISSKFQNEIKNCRTGSAQPFVSLDFLRNHPIKYHTNLETQHKIAAILSAYDDLIENNTRRIKILEEMAEALYREWFVKFRFPGHEKVKMVESELGMVPEGWEVVKLGDISDINISSIKKGDKLDEINYIDISSVSTGQIDKVEKIIFSEAPSRARRIVKHEDIIWSTVRPNRKSYSMILNPIQNLIVSTGFAVISAIKTPYTYLYFALTTDDFVGYLTNRATGAAYPAVNSGDFKKALVLLPPNPLLESFHDFVADFFDNRQKLHQKDTILRRTRNLLVPKLISGEIDVSNIEIEMGEKYK